MANIPDSHLDLLDAQVGTLATTGPDGRPQTSVIWFNGDANNITLSLNTSRQKTKNLLANPSASFLILDPSNAGRYLEVRGDVAFDDDDDYAFADMFAQKYGGVDLRNMDEAGQKRIKVTLSPVRVVAHSFG